MFWLVRINIGNVLVSPNRIPKTNGFILVILIITELLYSRNFKFAHFNLGIRLAILIKPIMSNNFTQQIIYEHDGWWVCHSECFCLCVISYHHSQLSKCINTNTFRNELCVVRSSIIHSVVSNMSFVRQLGKYS